MELENKCLVVAAYPMAIPVEEELHYGEGGSMRIDALQEGRGDKWRDWTIVRID